MLITTAQGTLRGKKETSVLTGIEFYSFLGIPYAVPPVGNLRFQSPKPLEKWTDIFDATREGNKCLQANRRNKSIIFGSEDCLYLNIHIPKIPQNNVLKPVMIFIHGGAFSNNSGTTDKYSADYLINYDVIIVTINYRLHVFGFLNLGLYECPGNVGLKDQVLAFKWIKRNIKFFGGDPDNVTLFGQSSGAVSIYLHILSPMSRGLFHKCIMQSAMKPRSLTINAPTVASDFASHLGFTSKDVAELLLFFKNMDAEELIKGYISYIRKLKEVVFPNAFVVQPFTPSEELVCQNAFLPNTVEFLAKTAPSVPIICGTTSSEGSVCFYGNTIEETIGFIKKDMKAYLPQEIVINKMAFENVMKKVKNYYFKGVVLEEKMLPQIVNFYTDSLLMDFYNYNSALEKSFCQNKIYNYYFDYSGNFNYYKKKHMGEQYYTRLEGSAHTDDLCYLFYVQKYYKNPVFGTEDRQVIKNICTLWTNFAKTGNPNSEDIPVEWKPITSQNKSHIIIKKDPEVVNNRINEERRQFWDKIFNEMFINR